MSSASISRKLGFCWLAATGAAPALPSSCKNCLRFKAQFSPSENQFQVILARDVAKTGRYNHYSAPWILFKIAVYHRVPYASGDHELECAEFAVYPAIMMPTRTYAKSNL